VIEVKKIVLDSSVLIALARERVDAKRLIEEKFEDGAVLLVPKACENEVKSKLENKAKSLLEHFGAKAVETEARKPDDAVVEAALKENAIVVTNDYGLKKRLKEKKIAVYSLRKGKLA
jgi:rRNA-processing protein FCF1